MDQNENIAKPKRGFAAMSPERQREIARKGGESVPPENRSFSRNRELAATAGRKGGEASHGHRSLRDENPGQFDQPSHSMNDRQSDRQNESQSDSQIEAQDSAQKFET
jgi:general stress protein YciG